MDDRQLGTLIRAARLRRGMRQLDLARAAGVGRSTISEIEGGNLSRHSVSTLRRVTAPIQVRVELKGWWRGGDGERLLSRRHSLLANSVAAFIRRQPGWEVEPEVSFSIWGERGVMDQLAWHEETRHLVVIELKTEFVDVNEMLGALDRKVRLAATVSAERGWRPAMTSAWLIVAESRTNRRHTAEHATLLQSRFKLDGRSLAAFLRRPARATTGLAFWTYVDRDDARHDRLAPPKAVRRPNPAAGRYTVESGPESEPNRG